MLIIISIIIGIIGFVFYYGYSHSFVNVKRDYEVLKVRPSSNNMKKFDEREKEIYDYISSLDK